MGRRNRVSLLGFLLNLVCRVIEVHFTFVARTLLPRRDCWARKWDFYLFVSKMIPPTTTTRLSGYDAEEENRTAPRKSTILGWDEMTTKMRFVGFLPTSSAFPRIDGTQRWRHSSRVSRGRRRTQSPRSQDSSTNNEIEATHRSLRRLDHLACPRRMVDRRRVLRAAQTRRRR